MKVLKRVSFLIASASIMIASTVYAKATVSNEYQAVVATAYTYFDGLYQGDKALMSKAFDMDSGYMKSSDGKSITSTSLKLFSENFTEQSSESWQGKILSVDIVDEKMAFVKFDFNTPKIHYTDYLIMLKTDGSWKITSKAYVSKTNK